MLTCMWGRTAGQRNGGGLRGREYAISTSFPGGPGPHRRRTRPTRPGPSLLVGPVPHNVRDQPKEEASTRAGVDDVVGQPRVVDELAGAAADADRIVAEAAHHSPGGNAANAG